MGANLSYTRSEKSRTYLGATLGYLFDGYNLLLITFLASAIGATFGVGKTTALFAVSTALVGSVVGGIGFGWLADRIGRRTALVFTILLFSVATIATGFSENLNELFALQFVAGLGLGGEWGVGFSLLNEAWGERTKGLAGGFLQAMFPAGGLIGVQTAAYFLAHFSGATGWRYAYMFVGIISMVLLVLRLFVPESKVWLMQVESKKTGKDVSSIVLKSPLAEIFSKDTLRWTIFGTIMVFGFMFYFYSGQTFYPSFFIAAHSPITTIVTIGSLVGIIAEVIIGASVDFLGRKKAGILFGVVSFLVIFPFLYTAYQAVGFTNLVSYPSFWTYLLLYFFQSSFAAIFGVWLGELYPTRMRATGLNFAYMVGRGFGGGLAPILVGLLIARGGHLGISMSTGMIIGAAVMLVGVFGLKETKGVDVTKI
ncbi:MAG: hypothetical protein B2I17_03625 [Thermoplasmatales archaeon B_DKE]|nr:MAG: hypothetical protein B2I17_03625 [Thermoplasmatales archaeon B_DKE]